MLLILDKLEMTDKNINIICGNFWKQDSFSQVKRALLK